jgi:hypothetical protein
LFVDHFFKNLMNAFINGVGIISPQHTWDDTALLSAPVDFQETRLTCNEPDYAPYIDVRQIRRMSRVIKMGVAASFLALKRSSVAVPDAIITATGYGCLEDTGTFLTKLIAQHEEALNPTPFILSTHNTIGSQIALLLQCQAYNQTYAHGAFSFESALTDALLQLEENAAKNILVGGIDEITDTSHRIQSRFGIFRKDVQSSLRLFEDGREGTVNGEGSAFFVLSGNRTESSLARLEDVSTFYKPDHARLTAGVKDFVARLVEELQEIDLVLLGSSGDEKYDRPLNEIAHELFPSASVGVFKHLCGEYPVASSFACWLATEILRWQEVPKVILRKDTGRTPSKILVVNQYFGTHYSLMLLSA